MQRIVNVVDIGAYETQGSIRLPLPGAFGSNSVRQRSGLVVDMPIGDLAQPGSAVDVLFATEQFEESLATTNVCAEVDLMEFLRIL